MNAQATETDTAPVLPNVAFWLMESIRPNRGIGLQVHP
jgi:hypothetical protein